MACCRFTLFGARDDWGGTPNPADGSLLHGDSLLFCEKFPTAPRLVYRHESLQKAFGKFCKPESDDHENQLFHCWNGDDCHGDRLYFDEKCADRPDVSGGGLGMPVAVFLFTGENPDAGSSG